MTRLVGEHFTMKGRPKRGFASNEEARAFREQMKQKDKRVYRCSICNRYHLGTPSQGARSDG